MAPRNCASEQRERALRPGLSMPGRLGLLSGLGGATAMVATYFDDSWHTDRGRDDFFIPPHLLLYGGVLLAALTVAAWGFVAWRAYGGGVAGVRAVLRDPAIMIAGIGGVTTLAAGPIDAAWHTAYGRDAVLWSPPHLLAVTGTLALSIGLLAGLKPTAGTAARVARIVAGAAVLGALQVPVLEYDSDVPQFSTVWFLPVTALGICLAMRLLDDLLPEAQNQLWASLALTAIRLATVGALAALGFSLTLVPPVALVVAVAVGLRRTRLGATGRLVLLGALTPLVWWPFLLWQSSVTTAVPADQLPAAVVLGAGAGALVSLARGDVRPPSTTAATAAAAVIVLMAVGLFVAPQARAHDPGQGVLSVRGQLTVSRLGDGRTAQLNLRLPLACSQVTAIGTVARRAGRTLTGPLARTPGTSVGSCTLTGSVTGLERGRWFVYAELRDSQGGQLETWLPVGDDVRVSADRDVYLPPPMSSAAGQRVVGGALLLGVALLLLACLRLSRSVARQ